MVRKKLLSLLVAAALVIPSTMSIITASGVVSEYASSSDNDIVETSDSPVSDFEYSTAYDSVTHILKYVGNDTEVRIPKYIDGKTVVSVGSNAFKGCTNLKSVEIPNTVETIEASAFNSCTSLEHIKMSDSVTTIKNQAFKDCTSLVTIRLSNNLSTIGSFCFSNCDSLAELELPDSVTDIDDYAFVWCGSLEKIKLPGNLSAIKANTFSFCSSLTEVVIPNSVESICENAFYGSSLENVVLPDSVIKIESGAFAGCKSLNSIVIPSTTVTVQSGVFSSSPNVVIHCYSNSAAHNYAKENSIQFVLLDADTESNESSESDTDNTSQIDTEGSDSETDTGSEIDSEVVTESDSEIKLDTESDITTDNIKDSDMESDSDKDTDTYVTNENDYTFLYSELDKEHPIATITGYTGTATKIIIPKQIQGKTVSIIDNWAFADSKVKEVIIPNTVYSIGKGAFYNCKELEILSLPQNQIDIEQETFYGCSSLRTVKNDNFIKSIGEDAFNGCQMLNSIDLTGYLTTLIYPNAFKGCSSLKDLFIPSIVKVIKKGAFSECTSLQKITLSDGLQIIEEYAFDKCTSLKQISLPESVQNIYGTFMDSGFMNCTNLKEVYVNNERLDIGNDTFYNSPNVIIYCSSNAMGVIKYAKDNNIPYVLTDDTDIETEQKENTDSEVGNINSDSDTANKPYNDTDSSKPDTDSSNDDNTTDSDIEDAPIYWASFIIENGSTRGYTYGETSSPPSRDDVPFSVWLDMMSYTYKTDKPVSAVKEDDGTYSVTFEVLPNTDYELASVNDIHIVGNYGNIRQSIMTGEDAALAVPENTFTVTGVESDLSISIILTQKEVYSPPPIDEYSHLYFKYTLLDDDTYRIDGYSGYNTEITIPNTINGLPVSCWADSAFAYNKKIQKVIIPDSIKTISKWAFSGCSSLKSVEISDSVTNIESDAFYNCEALQSIVIPNSVKNLGVSAFKNCNQLKSVTLGNNLTSLPQSVFESCSNLESISISSSVKVIDIYAFSQCSSLKEISISDSVLEIGAYAFNKCTSLEKIEIPESVKKLGIYAFTDCSSLKNVTILNPDMVFPYSTAFDKSYDVTLYCYPNSTAESYAVKNDIPYEYLPEPEIDTDTSDEFNIDDYMSNESDYTYEMGEYENTIKITGYNGTATKIKIPSRIDGKNVIEIASNAFDNSSVESVIIPNTVSTLRHSSFKNCESLKSVYFPHNVSLETASSSITIGSYTNTVSASPFENCPNLKLYCPSNANMIISYAGENNIPYEIIEYSDVYTDEDTNHSTEVDNTDSEKTPVTDTDNNTDSDTDTDAKTDNSDTPPNIDTDSTPDNPPDVIDPGSKPDEKPQPIGLLGDIDNDGIVTSADALAILRQSVGLDNFDESVKLLADIDGDGEITSADALEILRFSVGLSNNENVEQPIYA